MALASKAASMRACTATRKLMSLLNALQECYDLDGIYNTTDCSLENIYSSYAFITPLACTASCSCTSRRPVLIGPECALVIPA